MPCQEDNHIWDIHYIDKMLPFEASQTREILTTKSNLKTISICRRCKRVSFYDSENDQVLYGDMFEDKIN